MNIYEKLAELGVVLPVMKSPGAAYVQHVHAGPLIFVSGHIARRDGRPWRGKLGADVSLADGVEAARTVAVDLLGTLHDALGDLHRIARVVKLTVLVNSTDTFTQQHVVADGASALLVQCLGERGHHARSAFGVAQLPVGACVEIELVAEVDPA